MANNITSTYSGKAAGRIITPWISDAREVQELAYTDFEVRKALNAPLFTITPPLEPYVPMPSPTTDLNVKSKVAELRDIAMKLEWDPKSLQNDWSGAIGELSSDQQRTLMYLLTKNASAQIAWNFYCGNTALDPTPENNKFRLFDGLIKLADASTEMRKVSSPVALTSSNIQAELLKGRQLVPFVLDADADLKLVMSRADYRKLKASGYGQTYKGGLPLGDNTDPMDFDGAKIFASPYMPENVFFFGRFNTEIDSAVMIGANLLVDGTPARMKQVEYPNGFLNAIIASFGFGMAFTNDEQVVAYLGPFTLPTNLYA